MLWFPCTTMLLARSSVFFFFNDTATTEIYTLSLHDALPISGIGERRRVLAVHRARVARVAHGVTPHHVHREAEALVERAAEASRQEPIDAPILAVARARPHPPVEEDEPPGGGGPPDRERQAAGTAAGGGHRGPGLEPP